MKKVVSSKMVAHLWAHQTQSEARNAQGSMYFEGDTIYSYGSHFPIARHYKGVVLFNAGNYSVTTSKHQSYTLSSVNHKTVISVVRLDDDSFSINENFKYFESKIKEFSQKAIRARSEWTVNHWWASAHRICENANAYSKLMKRTRKFSVPDTETVKAAIVKAKARDKVLKAKLTRENAEKMKAWENGDKIYKDKILHLPYPYGASVCLRLKDEKTVETSQGAEFPLVHAKRIYAFIKKCMETKTPFQRNGERVSIGVFQIDRVSINGDVKAGCHNVKFDAIKRFAEKMGW